MKNQEDINIGALKELRMRFFKIPAERLGRDAVKSYSIAMENELRTIFGQTDENGKGFTLISVGGFGRRELCYGSDIDFMILSTRIKKKHAYALNNKLSDLLWRAGLSVGSSVRTISECIEESKDVTVMVNLIDSRFIAGDKKLYEKYSKKVLNYIVCRNKKHLMQTLVDEVEKRRLKYPDNYISEPDLKEGVGTLRDYNTICWINKITPIKILISDMTEEDYVLLSKKLADAIDFIFRIRNVVNMRTQKDNCLRFDLQEDIAELLGYGRSDEACVELMRQFFEHSLFIENSLDTIMGIIGEGKRKNKINGIFYMDGHYLESDSEGLELLSTANCLDAVVFWFLVRYQLDIGARLRQFLITESHKKRMNRNNPSIRLFTKTLSLKIPIAQQLLIMNKLGIISKYIPEFEGIRGLMPHFLFHKYSVDIHSIMAVRKMDEIIKRNISDRLFGILTAVVDNLNNEELLTMRLVLLLHDIGKSKFITTGHGKRGAKMFKAVSKRLGISDRLADLGERTIENHLMMSKIIRKRDISDPATIKEFAEQVKDKISLKWLLLLTYVDMSSVNDNLWNEWYEILADQLYAAAIEFFEKKGWQSRKSVRNKKNLLSLYGESMPYLTDFSDRFFNDIAENELKYIDAARKNGYSVKVERSFTKLFVWQTDRKRLMSDITGILFYKEISILAGTTYIIGNDIVDLFMTVTPENFIEKDWKSVGNLINSAENLPIEKMLKEKEQYNFIKNARIGKSVMPKVFIDQSASDLYTVIDIKAADRMGLLHDICCSLSDSGCTIILFKLSTVSDMASDSFYITGPYGGKIFDKRQLDTIIENINKRIL